LNSGLRRLFSAIVFLPVSIWQWFSKLIAYQGIFVLLYAPMAVFVELGYWFGPLTECVNNSTYNGCVTYPFYILSLAWQGKLASSQVPFIFVLFPLYWLVLCLIFVGLFWAVSNALAGRKK